MLRPTLSPGLLIYYSTFYLLEASNALEKNYKREYINQALRGEQGLGVYSTVLQRTTTRSYTHTRPFFHGSIPPLFHSCPIFFLGIETCVLRLRFTLLFPTARQGFENPDDALCPQTPLHAYFIQPTRDSNHRWEPCTQDTSPFP
ncbi:hypothetical protein BJV74DRAFT_374998 [Russula compacta]|nr:hypothetical protein BJV74DRAFT_374998 [Russula compacta]